METKVIITVKGAFFEGKAPRIVNKELTSAMWEAVQFLEREVKEGTPQGVYGEKGGGLKAGIHGEVIEKGTSVIKGVVAHQSKYGDVIEKGRTPGQKWPPEGSLLRWIEVKMGVDSATAKSLEFVIRRKIGKKGFEGAEMFESALEEKWPSLKKIFDRAGFDIARRVDGE